MALSVNTAFVKVKSEFDAALTVLWQSDECYQCSPIPIISVYKEKPEGSKVVSTFYPSETAIVLSLDQKKVLKCAIPPFENQGKYEISVWENSTCTTAILEEATNIYYPLITVLLLQFFFGFLWVLIKLVLNRRLQRQESNQSSEGSSQIALGTAPDQGAADNAEQKQSAKRRVMSLDSFRGFCLFLMIFVNYGGGKLWMFEHIPWNGLTFADLLFPWFVWIMGVSLAISMRSLRRKNVPYIRIFGKILWRSTKLFVIGIILNSQGGNDLRSVRIPGVLQRFAISYLAVATLHMFRATETDVESDRKFRDIIPYWPEWIVMGLTILIHTLLTFLLPIPGCPTGYIGPGGLQSGKYENCTGGAAAYIDRTILGTAHLYSHPTTEEVYETRVSYDPEGILGSLNSIFLTFLGLQAGKILLSYQCPKQRIVRWASWGVLCGIVAALLCGFSKENGYIPINKNLWSLSYVICMASFAFIVLSVFYVLIDVIGIWKGEPFVFMGMNSIVVYIGHSIVTGMLPWFWGGPETHWRYLAMNLGGAYIWAIVGYVLHKKKMYFAL